MTSIDAGARKFHVYGDQRACECGNGMGDNAERMPTHEAIRRFGR